MGLEKGEAETHEFGASDLLGGGHQLAHALYHCAQPLHLQKNEVNTPPCAPSPSDRQPCGASGRIVIRLRTVRICTLERPLEAVLGRYVGGRFRLQETGELVWILIECVQLWAYLHGEGSVGISLSLLEDACHRGLNTWTNNNVLSIATLPPKNALLTSASPKLTASNNHQAFPMQVDC